MRSWHFELWEKWSEKKTVNGSQLFLVDFIYLTYKFNNEFLPSHVGYTDETSAVDIGRWIKEVVFKHEPYLELFLEVTQNEPKQKEIM